VHVCFFFASASCVRAQIACVTTTDAILLCLFQAEHLANSWNAVCSVRSNDPDALVELHANGGTLSLFPGIRGYRN
jgi:hypothetical protein